MRIAICEDEEFIQNSIEKNVEKCLEITGMAGKCECFVSAEELLEKGNMPYALYILDVEMKKLSGLELAEHIRTEDRNAVIIFMTNHSEMMQKAFDVQAFQYLVKPIDSDTAHNVIMRALRIIREKRNYIRFTNKLKDMIFYYDEVECIESRRRKIIVHTEKRDYEFYGSLKRCFWILGGVSLAIVLDIFVKSEAVMCGIGYSCFAMILLWFISMVRTKE